MDTQKSRIENCHRLLQNILQDTFNIQTLLLTPPYTDYKKVDMGLRAAVWSDYAPGDTLTFFGGSEDRNRLVVVRSNLGFYNVVASVCYDGRRANDFVIIGPFRDSELSPVYYAQILKDSGMSPNEIRNLKHIYERIPMAQTDVIANITRHIFAGYFPEYESVAAEFMQFADQKKSISLNDELLDVYSIAYAERYKELLFGFLDRIMEGDSRGAKEGMQLFLKETMLLNHKNMRKYKAELNRLADHCYLALLNTSVHPLYILKQTDALKLRIEEETSFSRLEQIPGELCHKYCLLVRNYANAECSRLIREVMAYIQLHYEEELTLSLLAETFGRNASSLSNLFSRETGMSVTAYIQRTRVEKALKLLHTTEMSVSEVAAAVGYQDFSYFSKIFSRQVGCSPRAYRNGRS